MNKEDYISVHDIKSNNIDINKDGITVYQVQGLDDQNKAIIMTAGLLENPHDVMINKFDFLKKFKCFMVSRLYIKEELDEAAGRYQMIKIIICKENIPLAYLCFNFNSKEYQISTIGNKIELEGIFSITLHFMENNLPKYINLYETNKYPGAKMLSILVKYLYDKNVLKVVDKLI